MQLLYLCVAFPLVKWCWKPAGLSGWEQQLKAGMGTRELETKPQWGHCMALVWGLNIWNINGNWATAGIRWDRKRRNSA